MRSKKEKIFIVGIGEIAEVVADYFTYDSIYGVEYFVAEEQHIDKIGQKELNGKRVIPFERIEEYCPQDEYKAFVAIGYNKLNSGRARLYYDLKKKGYSFVNYISSKAFIAPQVQIGDNCLILEHNVLQRNVHIGNDVMLWSGNHIGHRSEIAEHTFLSSHVAISGYCKVGEFCFLGINSCLADHVNIASGCFIGAGVTILKDTLPYQIYRGKQIEPDKLSTQIVFGLKNRCR